MVGFFQILISICPTFPCTSSFCFVSHLSGYLLLDFNVIHEDSQEYHSLSVERLGLRRTIMHMLIVRVAGPKTILLSLNLAEHAQVELELSAQVQAAVPPSALYESMIPTIDPYVPPIIKKVPLTITNTLHATMAFHFQSRLVLFQLSYSHIHPMGWKHIRVPRSAPISETRPPKTGMADAMIYAMSETVAVRPNQTIQCLAVLWLRWWVPRRVRMKKYLAVIYV